MPGFVKTPKDEKRWEKAKEAANKSTAKDSESYWRLSNYIYHHMGKTEEDSKNAKLAFAKLNESEKLSMQNYKDFASLHKAEQQSIRGNEVIQMSDEKKYTAQEAAQAVLKKAEEMLKAHHQHVGWGKLHGKLEREGYSKESADKIAGSIKAKVEKTEPIEQKRADGGEKSADKEIHPKEHQEGESEHPEKRVKDQKAPEANPKEKAEGNNEKAGTTPTQVDKDQKNKPGFDEMKSTLKLAKFMGRMEHKKSKKNEA